MSEFKEINNYLKNRYPKDVRVVVPKQAKLRGMVKFKESVKAGNGYYVAVTLGYEHGFSAGTGAFDLHGAVSSESGQAYIQGQSMMLQSSIAYEAASRAGTKEQAIDQWFSEKVMPRVMSMDKRLEVLSWYGQEQKGTLSSVTLDSLTTFTVVLTSADFAEGIWVGMEGAPIDFFNGNTRVNTAPCYITSVDIDTRTIKGTNTSGELATLAANDTIEYAKMKHATSGAYSEMLGISQWFSQATLFGISTTKSLWKPSTHPVGGALSLSACLSAVTKAVNKGLDTDVKLFINHKPFVTLANTEAGLRRYNADVKKAENGSQQITFYSVNGAIEIVPHAVIKTSHGFVLDEKRLCYIGSTDITASLPNMPEDAYFIVPAQGKAGTENRLFVDLAIFTEEPGLMVKLTGITA